MKIGIDVMGGDLAPDVTVQGAIMASKEMAENERIVLIGDKNKINTLLDKYNANPDSFDIVHTPECIEMGENPKKAISQKPNSSISVGYKLLAKGEIDSFASAGNTGAMLFAAMGTVKFIPGVIRPCITTLIPVQNGSVRLLLDIGLNPDCKPDVLYQYGILGSLYLKHIYNVNNPKVALLNIGSEEEKGNLITKSTFQLMNEGNGFDFVGNIESNELFKEGEANVIVCDGFVGNIVLKEAEAFYELVKSRGINDEYFERFNFENYGGTPILGINKNVIIGHGISNELAIQNMLILSKDIIKRQLTEQIKKAISN